MSSADTPDPDIEERKLKLEHAKLKMEGQRTLLTAGSVSVSLLAACGTIIYGLWSTHEQAKLAFELEAARSVMSAPNPDEAKGRAMFFAKLFPHRLPSNFSADVNPADYSSRPMGVEDARMDYFKTVAPKLTADEALRLWAVLYTDEWARQPAVQAVVAGK